MILSRYVAREFLKLIGFLLFFFLALYFVVDFLEQNTRYFPKYKATGSVILEYYIVQIPKMVVDLLPFTILFASIICLWIFSRSGEISAMRAAGMSVFRICSPMLLIGAFLSIISFILSSTVVPPLMIRKSYVESVKIEKQTLGAIFFESNWVKGEQSFLHYSKINEIERTLERPEYFGVTTPGVLDSYVLAQSAFFDKKKGVWVLENAQATYFEKSRGKNALGVEFFAQFETTVRSQPPRILRDGVTPDQVSYAELKELIRQSQRAGGDVSDRQVDLYQKLSQPLSNLLFIFIAMPFALRKERQADTYFGIVICLCVAIVYWVGNISMRSLAANGVLNPLVAAWATPLVLGIVAFFIVRTLDRGQ